MRVAPIALSAGIAVIAAVGLLWLSGAFTQLSALALDAQRWAQTAMAGSLRGLRSGESASLAGLMAVTAAYGFVHALGPGHGKVLLGGAAFAGNVSLHRVVGLSFAAGLAQAVTAIVLVYGALALLISSARPLTGLAEAWLAPASYALIAWIGLFMVWRGSRHFMPVTADHHAGSSMGCSHAHGPSASDMAGLRGWRDAAALVFAIAIRPCTGAILLLFIAWQLDLIVAGIAGALAMGLGTACFNAMVASGAVFTRQSLMLGGNAASWLAPALQIAAGVVVAVLSGALFLGTLTM
ncbi:MAG: hypothetical protein AAGD12_06200 [Pseudomonadota bacterium]